MSSSVMQSQSSHPSATEFVLRASGINVYYGESHILRNVDLQIPKGEMVCLIGRNGVGKTTFLKTLIGLLQQRSGSIAYESHELLAQPPYQRARHGIGYVTQGRDIIPFLTVRENLLLGMEALPGGMGKNRHIDPFVYELFPILEQFLNRKGGDLSGGQQQQLAMLVPYLENPSFCYWTNLLRESSPRLSLILNVRSKELSRRLESAYFLLSNTFIL